MLIGLVLLALWLALAVRALAAHWEQPAAQQGGSVHACGPAALAPPPPRRPRPPSTAAAVVAAVAEAAARAGGVALLEDVALPGLAAAPLLLLTGGSVWVWLLLRCAWCVLARTPLHELAPGLVPGWAWAGAEPGAASRGMGGMGQRASGCGGGVTAEGGAACSGRAVAPVPVPQQAAAEAWGGAVQPFMSYVQWQDRQRQQQQQEQLELQEQQQHQRGLHRASSYSGSSTSGTAGGTVQASRCGAQHHERSWTHVWGCVASAAQPTLVFVVLPAANGLLPYLLYPSWWWLALALVLGGMRVG